MLTFIKTLHTIIYLTIVGAVLLTLYYGIVGIFGWPLYIAVGMVVLEGFIFLGNGMTCPLTDWAKRHGAEKGYVFDAIISQKFSNYLFRSIAGTFIIALGLVVFRFFQLR